MSDILDIYKRHYANLDKFSKLNAANFDIGPAHILPYIDDPRFVVEDKDTYAVVNFGRVCIVIPLTLEDPKDLIHAYVDVTQYHKTVTSVTYPYAKALESMGFSCNLKGGLHQYVYSTQHLIDIQSGGRKYRELRRLKRKHEREGIEFRELTEDDSQQIFDAEYMWMGDQRSANDSYRRAVYRQYNSMNYWVQSIALPSEARTKAIGAFTDGGMLAFAIGCGLSNTHWSCPYSHGSKQHASLMNLCWLELANLYSDLPYEIDGTGGQPGLNKNKHFFLSDDVLDKQVHVYNVSKVRIHD